MILITSGLPDEVIAVAASYNQTLQYGAQTPFSDQLAFAWEGSMWEYDAQHNSLITAGNGGTKPVQAAFTIYYNEGTQNMSWSRSSIDVGKLIRQHLPDKNGRALPADLSSGSHEFRDLSDYGIGSLFEGKVICDKAYGHVTYGCGGCCAYEWPYLWFDPLGIPLLDGSQNDVYATPSCGGNDVNVNSYFHTWTTANTSIATVNTSGYHSGVGVGSTSSTANGNLLMAGVRNCETAGDIQIRFPTLRAVRALNSL